jgi:hypothetical protein
MVVPKELGNNVSAVMDTKLGAGRYYRGNESIIVFQGVTMSSSLRSTRRHLSIQMIPDGIQGTASAKQKLLKKLIQVNSSAVKRNKTNKLRGP